MPMPMPAVKEIVKKFNAKERPSLQECREALVAIGTVFNGTGEYAFGNGNSPEYDLTFLATTSLQYLSEDPQFHIEFLAELLKVMNQHEIYLWDQPGIVRIEILFLQFNTALLRKDSSQVIAFRKIYDICQRYSIVSVLARSGLDVTTLLSELQSASSDRVAAFQQESSKLNVFFASLNMLYSLALFFASQGEVKEANQSVCRDLLNDILKMFSELPLNEVTSLDLIALRQVCAFFAVADFYDVVSGKLNNNSNNPLQRFSLNKILIAGVPSAPQESVARYIRKERIGAVTEEAFVEPGYCVDILCVSKSGVRIVVEYDGRYHRQHFLNGTLRQDNRSRDVLRDVLLKQLGYSVIHVRSSEFVYNGKESSFLKHLENSNLRKLICSMQTGQAKVIACGPASEPVKEILPRSTSTIELFAEVEKLAVAAAAESKAEVDLPAASTPAPIAASGNRNTFFVKPQVPVTLYRGRASDGGVYYVVPEQQCEVFLVNDVWCLGSLLPAFPMLAVDQEGRSHFEYGLLRYDGLVTVTGLPIQPALLASAVENSNLILSV